MAKRSNLKRYLLEPVEVVWQDAIMDSAETGIGEVQEELAEVRTLGYLLRTNRKITVVASDYILYRDQASVRTAHNIPTGWVTEVKPLARPRHDKTPNAPAGVQPINRKETKWR